MRSSRCLICLCVCASDRNRLWPLSDLLNFIYYRTHTIRIYNDDSKLQLLLFDLLMQLLSLTGNSWYRVVIFWTNGIIMGLWSKWISLNWTTWDLLFSVEFFTFWGGFLLPTLVFVCIQVSAKWIVNPQFMLDFHCAGRLQLRSNCHGETTIVAWLRTSSDVNLIFLDFLLLVRIKKLVFDVLGCWPLKL